ncbi:hypothetical protein MBLNU13_g07614t1 [Cladosporium sp. NU13]
MACPRCMEKATKVCGGCKDISYCSPECQQADWHVHKLLCKPFKDFAQPAPSANMRRIVVFLPDEKKPRFMWAPVKRHYSGYSLDGRPLAPWENIDKASVTDTEHPMKPADTDINAWTGQPLGYTIQVQFDDDFQAHYSERNQAVVSATMGMDALGWRGPIIAYCGTLRGGDHDAQDIVELHDMDTRAYSHLVAYLVNHWNGTPEQKLRRGPKVKCVKVACKGEIEKGLPSHQVVSVPRSHPIFNGGGAPSEVSKLVSMPLLTSKYPTSSPPLENQHITFMHIGCNPKAKWTGKPDCATFGFAPMMYQNDVGTHLVASATMGNLSAETLEAFCDFCQWHIIPYVRKYVEDKAAAERGTKFAKASKQVLDQMTNAKWTEYLEQWRAERKDASAAKERGTRAYTLEKTSSGLERM